MKYTEILENIIEIIVKSYAVIISVNLAVLIVTTALKNKFNFKKIRTFLTVVLICACLSASIVLVPRFIDLQQNSFITIENARLSIDETNTLRNSGSIMFYGIADAFYSDGNSIKIYGVNFFELSPNPYEEYYGDIVYAKHSRQLIAIKDKTTNG